jgi:hypothetical protein
MVTWMEGNLVVLGILAIGAGCGLGALLDWARRRAGTRGAAAEGMPRS